MKGIVVLAVLFLASILLVTHYEGRRSAYDHMRGNMEYGQHMRGEKLYMHRFSDIGLSADQRKSMEDIERKFYDAEQELISQIENALKELYRAYERDVISDQEIDKRITIVASLLNDLTRKKLFLEKRLLRHLTPDQRKRLGKGSLIGTHGFARENCHEF